MEDSFKVRVDKAFGSLDTSSSSAIKSTSSSLSSLWCLTDEEIERNEWIQDKITLHKDKDEERIHRLKNPKPYSSFLQGLLAEPSTSNQDLESDIQELDDDDDDEEDEKQPPLSKPDDHSNEDWNIRSSVGMDCTLDNEEEEDGYDKVALGKEEPADRFYMKEVNDYEVEIDSNNELPTSFTDAIRDPRANLTAAKLRLKEDDESAKKLGLQVSEKNITTENQIATPVVPDYVRNPSKYTHYTFDSMDDVDEESNRKAYMELFNLLKGSGGGGGMETEEDVSFDSSTSIVFTPRKKMSDGSMKKSKVDVYKKVVPVGIAAEDDEDNGVCMMDEDEAEIGTNKGGGLQRGGGRRYRTKGSTDVE
ncbi:hypothetical protein L2E82_44604 [Cichorium intybus]|uniref:Uncharacterized protein n=1 Tax=Cichorium intybus TaxID=13427 RepID=A0ACB8ZQ95_CICIN|nr:hypothetical protein L2E82_44604 [Cichorium intybus]